MLDDEVTEFGELSMEGNAKESVAESGESKEGGQGNVTVPYGEILVKLRKEKRIRKTRLTKSKHRLQKLFKTRAEREEIESCIKEIWEVLEEAQAVMDEMSVLALKMKDTQLQSEIMKESDSLQEETQKVIESAEENLTDMMLAAEKVTESVTVSPSVSVLPPPITLQQAPQPHTQGQEQQNYTSPPIGQQQSTQPSSLGQVSASVGTRISLNPNHHVEQSPSIYVCLIMARIKVRITSRINLDKRNQRNGATKRSRDFSNLIQSKTSNPSLSNSDNVAMQGLTLTLCPIILTKIPIPISQLFYRQM